MGADFTLSLIVAIADNGVIGRDGSLPWRLGSDLSRFRKLTMGHPLIMGRKTFESIGKPLGGRDSIVLTRGDTDGAAFQQDGVFVASTLENGIWAARMRAKARDTAEVFVIGGAGIFSQSLPLAQRLYLTRVHASPDGDVRWEPELDDDWTELSREDCPAGPRDEFEVTNLVFARREHPARAA